MPGFRLNLFFLAVLLTSTAPLKASSPSGKDYFLAAGSGLAWSGIMYSYNYFVERSAFARNVGPESWQKNLTHPWVIDPDVFATNTFGHSYQGGLYFGAARELGIGFYPSIAYSTFGSFVWEVFAETNTPSINDMVSTSLMAAPLGEALHRSSQLITGVPSQGAERFFRELLGFIVSPGSSMSRLLSGKAFKEVPSGAALPPFESFITMGMIYRSSASMNPWGVYTKLTMEYGDYSQVSWSAPFTYFTLDLHGSFHPSQAVKDIPRVIGGLYSFTQNGLGIALEASGLLWGQELYTIPSQRKTGTLGLHLTFLYEETSDRALNHLSLGPRWYGDYRLGKGWDLQYILEGGYSPLMVHGFLEPSPLYYYNTVYNYGWILYGGSRVELRKGKALRLRLNYQYLFSDDYDRRVTKLNPSESRAALGENILSLEVKGVHRNLLTLDFGWRGLWQNWNYQGLPDENKKKMTFSLMGGVIL